MSVRLLHPVWRLGQSALSAIQVKEGFPEDMFSHCCLESVSGSGLLSPERPCPAWGQREWAAVPREAVSSLGPARRPSELGPESWNGGTLSVCSQLRICRGVCIPSGEGSVARIPVCPVTGGRGWRWQVRSASCHPVLKPCYLGTNRLLRREAACTVMSHVCVTCHARRM